MKKGLYIFALLLATIALLAEIIIPHHHHEDEICFIDSHSDATCENHEHSNACKNHDSESALDHHEAESPEDHQNCMLDVEVILPSHQDNSLADTYVDSDDYSSIDGFAVLPVELSGEYQLPPGEQISHGPPFLQFYSQTVFGSPGLRAPPVC